VSLKRGLAGYIVPSKLYGILAAGRPYVAAVEEDSEVVAITRKHECGLVAEPGDPVALADRIRELDRDPVLRERLGEAARRAGLEFDRRGQIRQYDELLRDVVASVPETTLRLPLAKRAFDICLAGLGLLASAPLWAVIAVAIKLEDGGPVFYTQDRVGLHGGRFRGLKFRSMVPESDRRFGPRQAGEHDPRITRVGRLLRATAMDELPQLWNIFRGDMSFVGPRALMPAEIEVRAGGEAVRIEDVPGYEERHRVRPGLTGIAQIFADRDIPRGHKFRLDLLYIRKQSFWLDLKLIALSLWITFRGTWERRGPKF
jgi:lipopolysaccharide/colanic/teichoic acid biosynthesis glycosyltransferase